MNYVATIGSMLLGSSGEGSGRQSTLQDRREGCRRRAHVCRECLCSHQSRTATSTSNMATTVWNFFRRRPWRRLRRNSVRSLEKRAVEFVFVRARVCAKCSLLPSVQVDRLRLELVFAAALGGNGAGAPRVG